MNPGDQLWFVPTNTGSAPRYLTVDAVGPKWATFAGSRLRVDRRTLRVDWEGYNLPGTCYPSREAWEAEVERGAAWERLCAFVRDHGRPVAGLTTERIRRALEILNEKGTV